MMTRSEALKDEDTSVEENKLGPDYFGYYTREVACLLSLTEDYFPCASQTSDLAERTHGVISDSNSTKHNQTGKGINSSGAGALFCDAVGAGISNFKRERLNALLRQGLPLLTQEVIEMEDPVIALHRIQRLKEKMLSCPSAECDKKVQVPHKKLRLCSSSSSMRSTSPISCNPNLEGLGKDTMDLARPGEAITNGVDKNHSCCPTTETSRHTIDSDSIEVNDELQLLLKTDGAKVEETMKKLSDELSETLGHKKQKLEQLLDIIVSNYRLMTLVEKHQLQKMIQKLPSKNLNRVVEIVQRIQPLANSQPDEIIVDLEKLDNTTLWRLYYYVQTFENARKLTTLTSAGLDTFR